MNDDDLYKKAVEDIKILVEDILDELDAFANTYCYNKD